jgi:nucleotide-binding universal stress UspA family protein
MLPFRRILFPVDFSDASAKMAPLVRDTAQRFAADLHLVHAYELPPIYYGDVGSGVVPAGPPEDPDLVLSVQNALRERADCWFKGMDVRPTVVYGQPADVIHDAVKREGIDLVVLPTHGRGTARRMLLGSVTTKVLHDLSCAVLTDTHKALDDHKPNVPFQSILCAVGVEEETPAVLRAAAALAKYYGAKLEVVHAVDTPPGAWEIDFGPYRQAVADAAEDELRRLMREAGIDAPLAILDGPPPQVIRDEAAKRKADLIVTGRGEAQGVLSQFWSRLYGIVREAPCPVLSI